MGHFLVKTNRVELYHYFEKIKILFFIRESLHQEITGFLKVNLLMGNQHILVTTITAPSIKQVREESFFTKRVYNNFKRPSVHVNMNSYGPIWAAVSIHVQKLVNKVNKNIFKLFCSPWRLGILITLTYFKKIK